ncbi:40S ribosomal protein S27 [Lemmus lemmus]
MLLSKDLLNPSPEEEKRKHKKHMVQSTGPYFRVVKCSECYMVLTVHKP